MIRAHRLWTDADDKLVRKLAAERKPVAMIAATLGRSELSVAIRCEQIGVQVSRHGPG